MALFIGIVSRQHMLRGDLMVNIYANKWLESNVLIALRLF